MYIAFSSGRLKDVFCSLPPNVLRHQGREICISGRCKIGVPGIIRVVHDNTRSVTRRSRRPRLASRPGELVCASGLQGSSVGGAGAGAGAGDVIAELAAACALSCVLEVRAVNVCSRLKDGIHRVGGQFGINVRRYVRPLNAISK